MLSREAKFYIRCSPILTEGNIHLDERVNGWSVRPEGENVNCRGSHCVFIQC